MTVREKIDLSKGCWNLKRNLEVAMLLFIYLFILLVYGIIFYDEAGLSRKNSWVLPIFIFDFNSPCHDLLFPHSHKPRKNTFQ